MHPILHNRYRLAAYLSSWMILSLLLTVIIIWISAVEWWLAAVWILPAGMVHAFFGLSAYYLCRVFPLAQAAYKKVLIVFFSAGFISNALWIFAVYLWYGVLAWFTGDRFGDQTLQTFLTVLFLTGLLLYWLSAVMHYLIIEYERSAAMEKQTYELTILAKENELKMLRSQVDPHFLFNSLNSLNALIKTDPEAARAMTYTLADFFRKTISIGPKAFLSVGDEAELTGHFLSIEQIRFGPRLRCELRVNEDCKAVPIPVFLLQPLVENAVKHGISNLIEGGVVRINIHKSEGYLHISIENPYDETAIAGRGTGTGLNNVRKRLEKIYGGLATMSVQPGKGIFTVTIRIPLTTTYGRV